MDRFYRKPRTGKMPNPKRSEEKWIAVSARTPSWIFKNKLRIVPT
jgi:hypothetical protein